MRVRCTELEVRSVGPAGRRIVLAGIAEDGEDDTRLSITLWVEDSVDFPEVEHGAAYDMEDLFR